MKKKNKIITFVIIALISIGGLVFKGYFTDEVYVLNEDDKLSVEDTKDANNKNIEENSNDDSDSKSQNDSSKNKNIEVRDITIYISGEVNNPGIVTLKSDKRLADAVKALGGVTKKADMNNINLAMKLEDEMHYIIPKKGEKIASNANLTNTNNSSGNNMVNSNNNINNNQMNSSQNGEQNNKININTATIQELDQIPGVGEATANKILSYREENGNFKNIAEIKNVNGIGDKKYENMKELICVN